MRESEHKAVYMLQLLQNVPVQISFSYCNFLIIDKKKKLQMRSFLHVELAYDVAMRRYIPVNILFTSLTKNNTQD